MRNLITAAAIAALVSVLTLSPSKGASTYTTVMTSSGGGHGAMQNGHCTLATGPNTIGDCGNQPAHKYLGNSTGSSAPPAFVQPSSGDLSDIANIALLNTAQSFTALKTFSAGATFSAGTVTMPGGGTFTSSGNTLNQLTTMSGGLALAACGTNPSGSAFYVDSSCVLHFVNTNGDWPLFGAKFLGSAAVPWVQTNWGFAQSRTSETSTPPLTIDFFQWYNGGGAQQYGINHNGQQGKGFTTSTSNDYAAGTTTLNVVANNNIAAAQNVSGPGIAAGTTVSSYSAGTLQLSQALTATIPQGTILAFCAASNCSPTGSTTLYQCTLQQFTQQTSAVQDNTCINAYIQKYFPSKTISTGINVNARDLTGRESSVSGALETGEIDGEASGPDDAEARFLDYVYSESAPSGDGATTFDSGFRIRPAAAGRNSYNPVTINKGIYLATMPGGAASGVYGNFQHGIMADGGESVGIYDALSRTLTFNTSGSASSGQPKLQFPLNTSVNPGQLVTGSGNLPANATVSSVYQCPSTTAEPAGCGSDSNVTDVILSGNLTGTIAGSTAITFTGTFNDGSNFNGIFTDAFVNWTNQLTGGVLKAGTLLNSGTVLDVCGFGEDSTNTQGNCYGDIHFDVQSNTHGAIAGNINLVPAGSGCVQIGGVCLFSGAHTWSALQTYSAGATFNAGTVTFPDGSNVGVSWAMGSGIAMGSHSITGVANVQGANAAGPQMPGSTAATSTVPTLIPNRGSTTTGLGAQAAGNLSVIVQGAEIGRWLTTGLTLESGTLTGTDSGTWGSGGINGSQIGGTTPAAGAFTTVAVNNDITTKAHVLSAGTALSCSSLAFGTGAGTSPTCNSVTGDDHKFNINFTSGTTPSTSSPIATVTFAASYGSAPQCHLSANNGNAATSFAKMYETSTATTAVLNATSAGIGGSTLFIVNVEC